MPMRPLPTFTQVSLLLLLLLLVPLARGYGQDPEEASRPRFGGGVMLGIAGSQVDGDGYGGYHRPNAMGGVWVARDLGRHLAIRIELRYVGKGSLANEKREGQRYKVYSLALHYLELPILLEYTFLQRWSLAIGVGGGYLMGYQESNAYGSLMAGGRERVAPFELSSLLRLGWRATSHWTMRAGVAYSILPIRGRPNDVTSRIRTGQYNSLIELGVEYEI